MIRLPVVIEAAIVVFLGFSAAWQERKEFRRLWRELTKGEADG